MIAEIPKDAAPQVSVLMAVHNRERHLEEALRSMMNQTLRDIEIIVVDDASSDGTSDILARLAAEDPRIKTIRSGTNLQLTRALNCGLGHVRAPLVARMDADDVSMPHRLEVQKAFLEANPVVTLVGASIEPIDASGRTLRRHFRPRDSFATRWLARFGPGIPHPTFMFRTHGPVGAPLRYNADYPVSQDHEFICRLLGSGLHAVCLPDVLLRYRRHGGAISSTRGSEQLAAAKTISTAFQRDTLPPEVFNALADWRDLHFAATRATPHRIAGLFAGARVMLAHDERSTLTGSPGFTVRRHKCSRTMRRAGASPSTIGRAFMQHGPELIGALVLRVLEIGRLLPAPFRSDPWLTGLPGRRGQP